MISMRDIYKTVSEIWLKIFNLNPGPSVFSQTSRGCPLLVKNLLIPPHQEKSSLSSLPPHQIFIDDVINFKIYL